MLWSQPTSKTFARPLTLSFRVRTISKSRRTCTSKGTTPLYHTHWVPPYLVEPLLCKHETDMSAIQSRKNVFSLNCDPCDHQIGSSDWDVVSEKADSICEKNWRDWSCFMICRGGHAFSLGNARENDFMYPCAVHCGRCRSCRSSKLSCYISL